MVKVAILIDSRSKFNSLVPRLRMRLCREILATHLDFDLESNDAEVHSAWQLTLPRSLEPLERYSGCSLSHVCTAQPQHTSLDDSVEEKPADAASNMIWPQSPSKPTKFYPFQITQSARRCVPLNHGFCNG